MGRMPPTQLQQIKDSIDLQALIQSRGVPLKKRGSQWVGHCPFHEDSTPSFTVTPKKRLWHCFGCSKGGDAIAFIALQEGVSFPTALKRLQAQLQAQECTSTGAASSSVCTSASSSLTAQSTPSIELNVTLTPAQRSHLLARVAAFYHRRFLDTPEGLHYLTRQRGLRQIALFKTFQVGLADGSLLAALPQDPTALAELKAVGILTASGRELLAGCIVFPLWDASGAIVNLYGRRLQDGEVNHLYLPGARCGLWNAQAVKRSDTLILTEALIDAFSLLDMDIPNVMPCWGIHGYTQEHADWLRANAIKRIVLVFDGDAAGQSAASQLAQRLQTDGYTVAVITLPQTEDLNSFLTNEANRQQLRDWIESAFTDGAAEAADAAARDPDPDPSHAQVQTLTLPTAPSVQNVLNVLTAPTLTPTAFGFKLACGLRAYEVKGIAREATQLKATIKAMRLPGLSDPPSRSGFELHTLDLYSARSRDAYARACAALFTVEENIVKQDLHHLLEQVEQYKPLQAQPEEILPLSASDEAAGLALLSHPDLFGQILQDLHTLGVAAEHTNKLLCYLAVVSRKLDDPLSLLIQSRSAAGKSTLQNAVLQLVPATDKAHYTRLTSQALFYQDEFSLQHKVLAIEEAQGLGEAAYSLRALQSAKQISVATTLKDPVTGKLKTDTTTVQGPVAVLLTTTWASLDEETASRFLILCIDESQDMTHTILKAQRHGDTLAGYMAELDRQSVIARHHAAQRLLEPLIVINPYAEQLSFPVHSLRARRDHKKYLMLIKAIAFLHQKQRPIQQGERGGKVFRYIEVSKDDIAKANQLAQRVLGASLDELSAPARNLLKHIHAMVTSHCETHAVRAQDYLFTRRDVRTVTGWSDWQVRTHAKELEELEYLKVRNGAWGKEYMYELAFAGNPQTQEQHPLSLTDPASLIDELGAQTPTAA